MRVAAVMLVAWLAFSSGVAQAQSEPAWGTPRQEDDVAAAGEEAFIPGQIIVRRQLSKGEPRAAAELTGLDATVVTVADPCVEEDPAGGAVLQIWRVPPGQEEAALAQLRMLPGVDFAEQDALVYAAESIPPDATGARPQAPYPIDDPLYPGYQWSMQRVNLARGLQLAGGRSLRTVRVAVIDSGVDFAHPDLAGRLDAGKNYVTPGAAPNDDYGHGAHVTGVIAAIGNNGLGIAGSAPAVQIDPRKMLGSSGSGSITNLRTAICEAARDGAQIINMSLEIRPDFISASVAAFLKEGITFASSRGVLIIAAGGNSSGRGVYYPALFPEVVAVAALTVNNTRPSYGPIGSALDIAAPGGDSALPVLSLWPSDLLVRNKCAGTGRFLLESGDAWYCAEYGTSMAAPLVSGVAALVWSMHPAPTDAVVRSILEETARPVGLPVDVQGAGLLDAEASVRRTLPTDLVLSASVVGAAVPPGSAAFTQTIIVENPSLVPLTVDGIIDGLIDGDSWFQVVNVAGSTFTGAVRHGQPLFLTVAISPTYLTAGTHVGQIGLTAVRPEGGTISKQISVFAEIGTYAYRLILSPVAKDAHLRQSVSAPGFTWETPISPTIYLTGADSYVEVTLPFAFPMPGPVMSSTLAYRVANIYADGFVAFPGADLSAVDDPAANRCLPFVTAPEQAVFGWWADLDPTAPGAEVATFQPGPDRFVVQYSNVPSAAGVTPPYTVTFQIVLYRSGNIQLNYQATPAGTGVAIQEARPRVTVGVQARGGLFYHEVTCITDSTARGAWPRPQQSILIQTGDIY